MKDTLKNKCDLYADNFNVLRRSFKWNNAVDSRLGALLYTMENRVVDPEAIDHCRRVIKENTGIFSQFKDTTYFMTSVMLSLQSETEVILKGALNIYDALKKEGFHSSPYLVLAAVAIALQADPYNYKQVILYTKEFYNAMKEEHRFITSADDYGFAALLAMSQKSVSQAVIEMENCYKLLKESFSNSNAVQSLSHVLTFSEETSSAKCKRVVELHQALKRKKCKFGYGLELSFLGVVALLQEDTDRLADEISEASEYIATKKGFGYWSVTRSERTMFSAALVCDDYLDKAKKNTVEMTLANNITGIILAQQMATIAAASSAAAICAANN